MVSGPSTDSLDLSLHRSASGGPVQEHIHSAASEAQALTQEAAQLKAQAQSYQASRGLLQAYKFALDHHSDCTHLSWGPFVFMSMERCCEVRRMSHTGSCKGSGGKKSPGQHPAGAGSSQGAGTEFSCHGPQSEKGG